jgi:hypothetical protein
MADEHVTPRQERLVLWTKIFSTFKVALDAKKLVLAAAGIFVTAVCWWAVSAFFYSVRTMPEWKHYDLGAKDDWARFKAARQQWNLLHELAGPRSTPTAVVMDAADVATNLEQFTLLEKIRKEGPLTPAQLQERLEKIDNPAQKRTELALIETYTTWVTRPETAPIKPAGRLRVLPWFEDRGPNPCLLVASTVKELEGSGPAPVGWSGRQLARWFLLEEIPILLEPLFKFLTPVVYLFDRRAGFWEYTYLSLMLLLMLAIWGFFGGAITRIAAVQFARGERISWRDALVFARDRALSFFAAPVFPLVFVGIMTAALIVFGWAELIPVFGDIVVAGVLWPIVLLTGFIMAVVLVGLVGWPLMYATISTEASDSFDALSRSYSYVYQAPWQYLWYSAVAAAYGAALVFFVTFMGSLLVFLGKWGVSRAPGMDYFERDPAYLFAYAPTSFGWRDLLLAGNSQVQVTATPAIDRAGLPVMHYEYGETLKWYNMIGAFLVSVWIYALFLLMVGFAYSFFWSASTIIYFLMRHQVDDTDLDEVHLEGEGLEETITKPATPPTAAKPGAVSLTMVEAPNLRPATPPAPAPQVVTSPPAPLGAPPAEVAAPSSNDHPAPAVPDNGAGSNPLP